MPGVEWLAGVFDVAGMVSIVKQRDVCLRPAVQLTLANAEQAGQVTKVLEQIGVGAVPVDRRAGKSVLRVQSVHQAHALAMAMAEASQFKRDHWLTLMEFVRLRLASSSQRAGFGEREWGCYAKLRRLNGLAID